MYKNINVEAEHNELILENSNGDKVIIPANKRNWVQQKIKEGCHGCIDSLVETLPTASEYAQDGSLYSDYLTNDPPTKKHPLDQNKDGSLPSYFKGSSENPIQLDEITVTADAPAWVKYRKEYVKNNPFNIDEYVENRFNNPVGREKIEKIDGEGWKKKIRQEGLVKRYNSAMDYVSEQLVKNKPQKELSRAEWLNQMSEKEEEIIKRNPKYQSSLWADTKRGLISLVEQNQLQAFLNILKSSDYTTREKQKMLQDYANHPIMSKIEDASKILNPLTIPSKMVQSSYKKDYSTTDALKGKKNNAGVIEDIVTDPLNLVGLGIWGKLSKANKFAKIDDAYNVVKGLSKEEAIAKLSDLPKLKQIPNIEYNNIEDIIKNFTAKSDIDKKNSLITEEGNKYFKELNNSESLKRLKEFGEEYNIDLLDAYKKAEKRWDYNSNFGKHGKFQVAGDEVFKGDIVDAMGVSTLDKDGLMKTFLSKDKGVSMDLSDNSINYINKKTDIRDYHTAIWHELSHDINKSIIGNSPKLQKEIGEIFIDDLSKLSNENILNAKNKANDLYKSNFEKSNTGRFRNNKTVDETAKDEFNYITKPTETWAFLSTNLRQDLKNTGLIKDYNQTLTSEILEQAMKNNNTVFSRFEPYIKDKNKFIKLFNKMTLSIAPAAIYLQQKNEN